ncbi:MAG: hypothetical protein AAFZ15_34850 [Bacteroidota bacterium]
MKSKDLQKLNNDLSEQGWEKLANNLLNAKFDETRIRRMEKIMEQEGIYRTQKPSPFISYQKTLAIAASFLLLLTIGWLLFNGGQDSAQILANQHLEKPFQLNEGDHRGEDTVEITRGKALEAYNNQHYESALEYLLNIEAQGSIEASDYFQMGLCLMYQQKPNFKEAIKAFNKTKEKNTTIYKDEINWLLSLCYIMTDNKNEAINYLNKILDSSSSRQQDAAKKLLEEIKKSN